MGGEVGRDSPGGSERACVRRGSDERRRRHRCRRCPAARQTSTRRRSSGRPSTTRSTAGATLARRRPERGHVHRLDDARRAPGGGQAPSFGRRPRQRRLHGREHPSHLRDHAPRPRLHAVPKPRDRARRRRCPGRQARERRRGRPGRSTASSSSSRRPRAIAAWDGSCSAACRPASTCRSTASTICCLPSRASSRKSSPRKR